MPGQNVEYDTRQKPRFRLLSQALLHLRILRGLCWIALKKKKEVFLLAVDPGCVRWTHTLAVSDRQDWTPGYRGEDAEMRNRLDLDS